jgi:hypothetical protein
MQLEIERQVTHSSAERQGEGRGDGGSTGDGVLRTELRHAMFFLTVSVVWSYHVS